MIRGVLAMLWAGLGGSLCAILCIFLLPLGRGNRAQNWVQRTWARLTLLLVGVRLTIRGQEHIPEGPCILVANHRSNLDIFCLISALAGDVRFIAKMELMALVPISIGMWSVGHIFVRRSSRRSGRSAVLQAQGQVRSMGAKLLFFPEGTRAKPGEELPWRMGAFALAVAAEVPILPVALGGTADRWPPGQLLPRPGPVELQIIEPIPTHGLAKGQRLELKERSQAAVEAGVKTLQQA